MPLPPWIVTVRFKGWLRAITQEAAFASMVGVYRPLPESAMVCCPWAALSELSVMVSVAEIGLPVVVGVNRTPSAQPSPGASVVVAVHVVVALSREKLPPVNASADSASS